jgi:hypothetical protein
VDERAEQLKALRRKIAETWPDTTSREHVLRILDEMVWEAHQENSENTEP